jgi:hypothetical protein
MHHFRRKPSRKPKESGPYPVIIKEHYPGKE